MLFLAHPAVAETAPATTSRPWLDSRPTLALHTNNARYADEPVAAISPLTVDPASPSPRNAAASVPRLAFGTAGQEWWSISSGVGIGSDIDVVGQLGYHRFLADNFELDLILGGWYHDQSGNNAGSASLSLHFRYHIINEDRWSIYLLGGAGVIGSTDEVPEDGTTFNFLPTLGAGSTIQLGNSNARLDLGIRWHHISNANISGSDNNPDRDAPMIYVGVMFPF